MSQLACEQIDWPGIRAAAVAVGVREAARQASRDLSQADQYRFVERVMKRCSREGWITRKAEVAEIAIKRNSVRNVRNGADSLATAISDNCTRARALLSKTSLNGAKSFSELPGEALTRAKTSAAFRNVTAATAQIGGWDENKDKGGVNVMVNVGILGQ